MSRIPRCTILLLLGLGGGTSSASAAAPGGFLEQAISAEVRPRLSAAQIAALLPARGRFTFPPPYLTEAARLTNASDCAGADCVLPVGYSYWRNINNHAGSNELLAFLGLDVQRGGSGPTLFRYDKVSGAVAREGPLFPTGSPFRGRTGEGWYFSATQATALYLNDGPRLLRYDVVSREFETVFDAAASFGVDRFIWQAHSSDDDRVHSATLRRLSTSEMLGCLAYLEDDALMLYYPRQGVFDECHVDKSGRWLVILQNVDGLFGLDNLVVDLESGTQTLLLDQNGALGHADLGHGYMVGEDDWAPLPGVARVWKFGASLTPGPTQGLIAYRGIDWALDLGHVAHGNARAGVPPESQYSCNSNASRLNLPRANEIVCYRLDDSLDVLVVAPVLTDLDAPGGGDDYSQRPKGNLDVTGDYFIWTSNSGGNRLDAFIVKVPAQLLVGAGLPGEVSGLAWRADGRTLDWNALPGAQEYHVYRGGLADPALPPLGACRDDLDDDRSDTWLWDDDAPALGRGYSYLVTAESAAQLEGPLGFATGGPRVNAAPCP